jgi:hypothetical protein
MPGDIPDTSFFRNGFDFSGIPGACDGDSVADKGQPEHAIENQKPNPASDNKAAIIVGKVLSGHGFPSAYESSGICEN